MTINVLQTSVSAPSYSQDIMKTLPNVWRQLIGDFAVPGV